MKKYAASAILLASFLTPPLSAHANQSQSEVKPLIMALYGDVEGKLKKGGEENKRMAMVECFAISATANYKFPRIPEEILDKWDAVCKPLLAEKDDIPASAAAEALKKYGEQLAEVASMMSVGPLGHPYDGSRQQSEQVIAASKLDDMATKLTVDFVMGLPHKTDEELAAAGVDVNALTVAKRQLWTLVWGASYAEEMYDKVVVPQLKRNLDKQKGNLEYDSRVQLMQAEGSVKEICDLLDLADPKAPLAKRCHDMQQQFRDKIDEIYRKEIAANRCPSDNYKGADRKHLIAIATDVLKKRYKKIYRIGISAEGWGDPVTKAWWTDDGALHWSKTRRLGGGFAAVDTGQKGVDRYMVLPFEFDKSWDYEAGKYRAPKVTVDYWGPPILKKNINK